MTTVLDEHARACVAGSRHHKSAQPAQWLRKTHHQRVTAEGEYPPQIPEHEAAGNHLKRHLEIHVVADGGAAALGDKPVPVGPAAVRSPDLLVHEPVRWI